MKRKMNRRDFLEVSSKVLVTSMLSSYLPKLHANPGISKKMIHIHFEDGAHHLLGLDPLVLELLENRKLDPVKRDDREFIPLYEDKDLIDTGSFILGPAASSLAPFSQDFSIVAGIQGVSISHTDNARFNMSGDEDGRDNLIVAEVYNQLKSGVLGVGLSTALLRDEFSRTQNIDLGQIVNTKLLSAQSQNLTLSYRGDSLVAKQMLEMQKQLATFKDLKQSLMTDFSADELVSNLIASMKLGLSNFNFITLQNGLDTHSGHAQHSEFLNQLLTRVAKIIEVLKKTEGSKPNTSLYDETVILITTDFGRTSYNQNSGTNYGTDHNPLNTTFMLGGGLIRGGVKIGASTVMPGTRTASGRSALTGIPFDFRAEKVVEYKDFINVGREHNLSVLGENVGFIYPGHVLATICAALDVKTAGKLRNYKAIKGLLKQG